MTTTRTGPNIHPNPSFEGGLNGGLLFGEAEITGAYGVYDGALALYLFSRRGFPSNVSSLYDIYCNVEPGVPHTWTWHYNAENANSGQTVRFQVFHSDPTYGTLDDELTAPGGDPGWVEGTLSFTPAITPILLRYTLPIPAASVNGYVLVDDCTLNATLTQYYPPENGPLRKRQTWHEDDIMGTLVSRKRAVRDEWRNVRDSWDTDEVGRDELDWRLPRERPVEEPR